MGALFTATLTEKNNKTYSRTRLLVTSRVGKFWEVIDSTTVSGVATRFHYQHRRDRRVSPWRFKTSATKSAFWQQVREAENETWINVHVDREYRHGEYRVVDEVYRFNCDDIIQVWDDPENSGYSYIDVEDVHFRRKRFRTTHTIAEIEAAASASQSNSPS